MDTERVVEKGNDEQGTVSIKLETVTSEKKQDDAVVDATRDSSGEQLMYLNISLCASDKYSTQHEGTHLIVVVDNSGSMAGNPWKQVQQALVSIIGSSITQENVLTDLIVYNQSAKRIPIHSDNYAETIDKLAPSGATNFVAAFDMVFDVIFESRNQYTRNVVVFLTDGHDSVNRSTELDSLVPTLHDKISRTEEQVIIHTVGFSRDHAFKFLKKVSDNGGSSPGMFRYCEPGDDKTVLLQKLQELFDFITDSGKTCNIHVELLNKDSTFVCQSKKLRTTTIKGKMTTDETKKEVVLITGEVWVSLDPPSGLPDVKVTVELDGGNADNNSSAIIPCTVRNIERKALTTADEKSLWRLKILERNMDTLVNKAANAVSTKSDVSHLQTSVQKYQKLISKTKVFGNGISKQHREQLFVAIRYIQKSLDEVHSMLADYLRTGTDSLSLLARAHDMRYQAVFKRSRLQRVMDQRVSKNMQQATLAQQQLASLVVDKVEVENLSQDAKEFFYCILSQNSVSDVLLGDEKEDAIGFGLAVQRSEVVMDEPTLVRIQVISGTLVSRSAMLDALEYKINVSSHLKAHGGFTFTDSELGVTTVGQSREPINAWLPLFITPSHWERIKVLLKPCLGTFCTLDPLGYQHKQLDVLFSVLGAMVGQLSENNIGEHQLKLLFAVLRTCTACLVDFDLKSYVQECLSNFLSSPAGRTKDIIPNLYTIIGYALSLPMSMRQEIFNGEDSIQRFLLAFISEWLRRCAGSLYREVSLAKLSGILKALIGNAAAGQSENCDKETAESKLVQLCLEINLDNFEITPFDPAADITEPDIEVTHNERTDKAMDMWAEKKTGLSENIDKIKRKAYQKAMIEVKKWCDVGKETESDASNINDNLTDANNEADDKVVDSKTETEGVDCTEPAKAKGCVCVTETVLQAMARLITQLTKSSYPHVTSLPGLIAFVTKWLTCKHDSAVMDENFGLAPDSLIQEMKDAVRQVYKDLKDIPSEAEEDNAEGTANKVDDVVLDTQTATGSQPDTEQNVYQAGATCQTKSVNFDVADNDDLGYDIHDDDDDGDMTYETDYPSSANTKSKSPDEQKQTCLPKLLNIIDRNCDVVLSLRAMLCQAVRYHSNSKARTAIASKEMLDTADDSTILQSVLDMNQRYLEEMTVNARQNILNQALWRRANHCMLYATTPLAFVGYLMNTYTGRNEGFRDLIELFMTTIDMDSKPPCLKEKVHILLTGKYLDCIVLDNGNRWLPEKKLATSFRKLLGDEIWGEFEAELRSIVEIHVYRESDIPNRHGHCNSNPYIPNELRKRLGMALLPESEKGGTRRRKRVS